MDISQLSVSYQRAKAAAHIAMTQKEQVVKFDDCGLFRLLYMVKDKDVYKRQEQYIIFGIRFRPGHCHVWYRNIWYDFKQN